MFNEVNSILEQKLPLFIVQVLVDRGNQTEAYYRLQAAS
jgi:hypothetical protein